MNGVIELVSGDEEGGGSTERPRKQPRVSGLAQSLTNKPKKNRPTPSPSIGQGVIGFTPSPLKKRLEVHVRGGRASHGMQSCTMTNNRRR